MRIAASFTVCALLLTSCHPKSCILEPGIFYEPSPYCVASLPSAFEKLSPEERSNEWGKELVIADAFARDLDLYRAITTYKRALILLPEDRVKRKQQIEYSIIQCYYLGQKYGEMIALFEESPLVNAPGNFPALGELLLMLYDAYQQTGCEEKALCILNLIEKHHPNTANNLRLSTAVKEGDICCAAALAPSIANGDVITNFLNCYTLSAKSPSKAQMLNALLPGAGYYYVGQKRSAFTSFAINALFIAAAYHFFHQGNVAAGIITASLETGWYFGGINGAGLAAKEYNEWIYSNCGKEAMQQTRLFPVLMFHTAF